jgi:hypothetical protein
MYSPEPDHDGPLPSLADPVDSAPARIRPAAQVVPIRKPMPQGEVLVIEDKPVQSTDPELSWLLDDAHAELAAIGLEGTWTQTSRELAHAYSQARAQTIRGPQWPQQES